MAYTISNLVYVFSNSHVIKQIKYSTTNNVLPANKELPVIKFIDEHMNAFDLTNNLRYKTITGGVTYIVVIFSIPNINNTFETRPIKGTILIYNPTDHTNNLGANVGTENNITEMLYKYAPWRIYPALI